MNGLQPEPPMPEFLDDVLSPWTYHETPRRPVVWSKASIIYYAHASQALVEGAHFPSKRRFSVPQPSPIQPSPYNYEPPTIVTLSPCDMWLFAYFPGVNTPGLGCLWRRGDEIDEWREKEWWNFARGVAPIASTWLGGPREWEIDMSGVPKRLPQRGPLLIQDMTLMLVTQACRVHLYTFSRQGTTSGSILKMLECGLGEQNFVNEASFTTTHVEDAFSQVEPAIGARVAVVADIIANYDSTVVIAMQTATVPLVDHGMDMTPDQEMPQSQPTDMFTSQVPFLECGVWGQQSSIELYEVKIRYMSRVLAMAAYSVGRISTNGHHPGSLEIIVSPESALVGPSPVASPSKLQIVTTQLNVDQGAIELSVYHIVRSLTEKSAVWETSSAASRTFLNTAGVLTVASRTSTAQTDKALGTGLNLVVLQTFASVMEGGGSETGDKTRSSRHRVRAGELFWVSGSDLQNMADHEHVPIYAGDLTPVNIALSPSKTLVCTVDGRSLGIGIVPVPAPTTSSPPDVRAARVASILLRTLKARSTMSDVVGYAVTSAVTKEVIDNALIRLVAASLPTGVGPDDSRFRMVAGVILEVQRAKASMNKQGDRALTRTIQTICSISAANSTFSDHKEKETVYDLDVIWRLISVCTWFIEFLEGLAKKCVYLGDSLSATDSGSSTSPIKIDTDDDLFGSAPPTPVVEHQGGKTPEVTTCPPELLHLIHPFLLKSMATLVGHIIRLKKQVTDTPVSTRKAQLAKLCLSELVNAQGIDLEALPTVLIELSQSASQLSEEHLRRSLATCQVMPELRVAAIKAGAKFGASNAVDKLSLFFKSADLSDDQFFEAPQGRNDDIVSKSTLGPGRVSECARCQGRSHVATEPIRADITGRESLSWWLPCICGGDWKQAQ